MSNRCEAVLTVGKLQCLSFMTDKFNILQEKKMQRKKTKKLCILAAFVPLLLISCATFPTVAPEEPVVEDDTLGKVEMGYVQYEYKEIGVGNYRVVYPLDSTQRLTLVEFLFKNTKEQRTIDFSGITLKNEKEELHPDFVRYFAGKSSGGFDWGYGEKNPLTKEVSAEFKKHKTYTVILGYICDGGERFDELSIFGQKNRLGNVPTKKPTFSDKFMKIKEP